MAQASEFVQSPETDPYGLDPAAVTFDHVSRYGSQGGDQASSSATISANGRFVAFSGTSTNLIPGKAADINVKDLLTGVIVNEAVSAAGASGNFGQGSPVISADGGWVVFFGNATNLIPPQSPPKGMIYAASLTSNLIEAVSTTSGGAFADRGCSSPDVSADGRFVVFSSAATNLAAGGNATYSDVFIKDRQTGTVTRLSTSLSGGDGNGESVLPKISADGRLVVFQSDASNLTAGDTNGYPDVFLWDRFGSGLINITGGKSLANPNNGSFKPDVSWDEEYGGVVVFETGKGYVAQDACNSTDIYAYDLVLGTFTLASSRADGSCTGVANNDASVSGDGRFVVFTGYSGTLVPGDGNGVADVFVKDLYTERIALVSRAADGTPGNLASGRAQLSLGGEWIVFESDASTLAPTDATATASDVFLSANPLLKSDGSGGIVKLGAASYSAKEGAGSVRITLLRTGSVAGKVGVRFQAADGTAAGGSDFGAGVDGTITWGHRIGAPTIVEIPILPDAFHEPLETFTVSLSEPTGGAALGSPSVATVSIVDDDPLPTVQFSRKASAGAESVSPAVFDVHLSAAAGGPVTLAYTTVEGTAKGGGADFVTTGGTLTFTGNETHRTISVPIAGDAIAERGEAFTVKLSKPSTGNAALGANATHAYTIIDDDPAGAIQLSAEAYAPHESAQGVTITATRLGGTSGAVEVSCATFKGTALEGSDYQKTARVLRWESGEGGARSFVVPIAADLVDEPDETFTVKLTSPRGGAVLGSPSSATVTIIDDNPTPTVSFETGTAEGPESTTTALIDVVLSGPSSRTVSAAYAIAQGTALAGRDYRGQAGTLTFKPGQTRASVKVPIINDRLAENPRSESFTVALAGAVNAGLGAPNAHVYTILDEDVNGAIALSSAAYSIGEGGPKVRVTVRRLGGTAGAVSAILSTTGGTATGADYGTLPPGFTVSWADGRNGNQVVEIPITNDAVDEANETFRVGLSAPTGGAVLGGAATVTIIDNDPAPKLSFASGSSTRAESATKVDLVVTVTPLSEQPVSVNFATVGGTAKANEDFLPASGTLQIPAGAASGTITVFLVDDSVPEPGPGQTFRITLSRPVNAALGTPSSHALTITDDDP